MSRRSCKKPVGRCPKGQVPVLIVQRTKDAVVDPGHALELERALSGPEKLLYIEEDDHVFTERLPDAIEATLDWFRKYL